MNLSVIGIGPGDPEDMTLRAHRALENCDTIVGYQLYVDLIRPHYPNKTYLATAMTREADRCRLALEAARQGADVAMVCSGDSGIYGMAALLYELRGEDSTPPIQVIPGLTAACSGGAVLGAPLTHDFAVVSLSDRLTPWETIEARLSAAAKADFSLVLYNPRSKGRPDHLRRACDILLQTLPPQRPCGVVRNIGRPGEECRLLTLGELRSFEADMFCTIFIGNHATKIIGARLVTPRGYRDV